MKSNILSFNDDFKYIFKTILRKTKNISLKQSNKISQINTEVDANLLSSTTTSNVKEKLEKLVINSFASSSAMAVNDNNLNISLQTENLLNPLASIFDNGFTNNNSSAVISAYKNAINMNY